MGAIVPVLVVIFIAIGLLPKHRRTLPHGRPCYWASGHAWFWQARPNPARRREGSPDAAHRVGTGSALQALVVDALLRPDLSGCDLAAVLVGLPFRADR